MATFRGEDFKFPDEKGEDKKVEDKIDFEVEGTPEIEVVDDTPPEDRNRKPMTEPPKEMDDDELSKYDESVQNRIKHFTKGYHEERRRAEAAERAREEAIALAQRIIEENKQLKGSLNNNQQALQEQAKKVVANEVEKATQKYKEAYEAGDPDGLAKAQQELTAATIRADKINTFQPKPLQVEDNSVQTQPQVTQPPREDPKALEWQKANPWWGQDEEMTSFAIGVHTKLIKSGVNPQSDEYYEKLNSRMKTVFPDAFESEKPADAPTQRPTKSNVAPATRSTAPKKIVLTQTQVNIAKRLGVPLELYARKVAEEQLRSN
jgi:hypothetical protein